MERDPECGTRMLEEYLDKEIFICLRENRYAYGILRSFDHYYNVLLENAREIFVVDNEYSEIESEVFILRGENILMFGIGQFDSANMRRVEKEVLLERAKSSIIDDDLDYITL